MSVWVAEAEAGSPHVLGVFSSADAAMEACERAAGEGLIWTFDELERVTDGYLVANWEVS